MPCNVDIATQEILKLAEGADPQGVRTMGVLTKPDLAVEKATKEAILNLVRGKTKELRLGYYVVKNRSADDNESSLSQRRDMESAFFAGTPWNTISGQCGIDALKLRLTELLSDISKKEFPHVRLEINKRLLSSRAQLKGLGPSRSVESTQRVYLGKLANRFQSIARPAVSGYYTEEEIFSQQDQLKLATQLLQQNEDFSDLFARKAHMIDYGGDGDEDEDEPFSKYPVVRSSEDSPETDYEPNGLFDEDPDEEDGASSTTSEPSEEELYTALLEHYPELADIVESEPYSCPAPTDDSIRSLIRETYKSNRGPDLGTVCRTLVAAFQFLDMRRQLTVVTFTVQRLDPSRCVRAPVAEVGGAHAHTHKPRHPPRARLYLPSAQAHLWRAQGARCHLE